MPAQLPVPRRRHRPARRHMRGKHFVKARQMHPRRRHQRRRPGDEAHGLAHDVRVAVAVRGLQAITHLPLRGQSEALDRHQRLADVTGQPVEFPALRLPLIEGRRDVGHSYEGHVTIFGQSITAPLELAAAQTLEA